MGLPIIVLLRFIAYGTVLLFSTIILGLSAHLISVTTSRSVYFTFSGFALAVALISLLLLGPLLVMSILNNESPVTMTAVELGAMGFLWIMWLAVGSYTADTYAAFRSCSTFGGITETVCRETAGITAFSFLSWIAIMGYLVTLLVFATISTTRGNKGFTQSVMTHNFLAPASEKAQYAPSAGVAPQFTGQSGPIPSYPPPQPGYPQPQPVYPQSQQVYQQAQPQYPPPTPGVAQV